MNLFSVLFQNFTFFHNNNIIAMTPYTFPLSMQKNVAFTVEAAAVSHLAKSFESDLLEWIECYPKASEDDKVEAAVEFSERLVSLITH